MPIAASDLKAYQAASMPEDDASTTGGAIATAGLVEFTDVAADDDLEAVSDNAADTMNLTITARNAAGAIVSETTALAGTTPVVFSSLGVIERFMKSLLASAAAGIVTIRRSPSGATVATLAAGKTSTRRLFYDSASEAGATTRFEKLFLKNEHGTLTLNNAALKLTTDPAATIRIGGAPSKDDSATVTNRKTTPASVTFVDDGVSQSVPGGTLEAAAAIGVWAEMQRGAGAAAIKDTFTVELSGTTV
jgi:hypothetical protein